MQSLNRDLQLIFFPGIKLLGVHILCMDYVIIVTSDLRTSGGRLTWGPRRPEGVVNPPLTNTHSYFTHLSVYRVGSICSLDGEVVV